MLRKNYNILDAEINDKKSKFDKIFIENHIKNLMIYSQIFLQISKNFSIDNILWPIGLNLILTNLEIHRSF